MFCFSDCVHPFSVPIGNNDIKEVEDLLKTDDPSACMNQAIAQACEQGRLEIIQCLLKDERVNPFDQRQKLS